MEKDEKVQRTGSLDKLLSDLLSFLLLFLGTIYFIGVEDVGSHRWC